MAKLRVGTFNVENLFARYKFNSNIDPLEAVRDGWDANQRHFTINDEDSKQITAEAIKALDADVLALQEVENLDWMFSSPAPRPSHCTSTTSSQCSTSTTRATVARSRGPSAKSRRTRSGGS